MRENGNVMNEEIIDGSYPLNTIKIIGCKMETELYIYIDESGDLGYSSDSSNYFVMGAIVTKNKRCIEKKAED